MFTLKAIVKRGTIQTSYETPGHSMPYTNKLAFKFERYK
jgi:hypothetical protein